MVKSIICRYYKKFGKCRNGDECPFSHDLTEDSSTSSYQNERTQSSFRINKKNSKNNYYDEPKNDDYGKSRSRKDTQKKYRHQNDYDDYDNYEDDFEAYDRYDEVNSNPKPAKRMKKNTIKEQGSNKHRNKKEQTYNKKATTTKKKNQKNTTTKTHHAKVNTQAITNEFNPKVAFANLSYPHDVASSFIHYYYREQAQKMGKLFEINYRDASSFTFQSQYYTGRYNIRMLHTLLNLNYIDISKVDAQTTNQQHRRILIQVIGTVLINKINKLKTNNEQEIRTFQESFEIEHGEDELKLEHTKTIIHNQCLSVHDHKMTNMVKNVQDWLYNRPHKDQPQVYKNGKRESNNQYQTSYNQKEDTMDISKQQQQTNPMESNKQHVTGQQQANPYNTQQQEQFGKGQEHDQKQQHPHQQQTSHYGQQQHGQNNGPQQSTTNNHHQQQQPGQYGQPVNQPYSQKADNGRQQDNQYGQNDQRQQQPNNGPYGQQQQGGPHGQQQTKSHGQQHGQNNAPPQPPRPYGQQQNGQYGTQRDHPPNNGSYGQQQQPPKPYGQQQPPQPYGQQPSYGGPPGQGGGFNPSYNQNPLNGGPRRYP